jgi:hypothetical protein
MGTITRTFANNITTSGVFKPTAFNNASFDNVTSVPALSMPAGGSMVLLSTQTASASSSISFTTGIDSTYKEYMFIFNNIHPSTTSHLTFQGSTDGGSSYGVTCTSSSFHTYHDEGDSVTVLGYKTGADVAQSSSYVPLFTESTGSGNDESYSGTLHIFNPSNTTFIKHFIASNNNTAPGGYTVNSYFGGYLNTTSAINAIDFKMSSGNIDDGTIQMFGIL